MTLCSTALLLIIIIIFFFHQQYTLSKNLHYFYREWNITHNMLVTANIKKLNSHHLSKYLLIFLIFPFVSHSFTIHNMFDRCFISEKHILRSWIISIHQFMPKIYLCMINRLLWLDWYDSIFGRRRRREKNNVNTLWKCRS